MYLGNLITIVSIPYTQVRSFPVKTAMTVIPQQSMIINGTGGNSTSGWENSVSTPIIINGIGGNSSSSGSGSSSGALLT